MAYIVTLCDLPDVSEEARHRAQKRFRDSLEKHYLPPGKVAKAFRLWNAVAGGHGRDVSPEDGLAAAKFSNFLKQARAAGLHGLGDPDLAYFDIKLTRRNVIKKVYKCCAHVCFFDYNSPMFNNGRVCETGRVPTMARKTGSDFQGWHEAPGSQTQRKANRHAKAPEP